MDIRKIIDHFMLTYSPGDMVDIERIVDELRLLGNNEYLTENELGEIND